jgi:hypothetical protein
MPQKFIWVIEDGSYSDHHLVGVYTTKRKADYIARVCGGDVSRVPLDPGYAEIRAGLSIWTLFMLRDGTVKELRAAGNKSAQGSTAALFGNGRSKWDRTNIEARWGECPILQAAVWARDARHAIKVANEFRSRMIASGEWKAPKK